MGVKAGLVVDQSSVHISVILGLDPRMTERRYFSRTGADGFTPFERLERYRPATDSFVSTWLLAELRSHSSRFSRFSSFSI